MSFSSFKAIFFDGSTLCINLRNATVSYVGYLAERQPAVSRRESPSQLPLRVILTSCLLLRIGMSPHPPRFNLSSGGLTLFPLNPGI